MKISAILPLILGADPRMVADLQPPKRKTVIQRLGEWYQKQREKSRIASELADKLNADSRESRQSRRSRLRMEAFRDISKKYPGESRRLRRSMAFDRVRNMGKQAA